MVFHKIKWQRALLSRTSHGIADGGPIVAELAAGHPWIGGLVIVTFPPQLHFRIQKDVMHYEFNSANKR